MVRTPCFQGYRVRVQSLAEELRSHKLCNVATDTKDSGTTVLNIEFLEDMNLYLNEKKSNNKKQNWKF